MDFNPNLKPWQRPEPNQQAGKGSIEIPGDVVNIVHQTRATQPTDYENKLGEVLEQIFGDGVVELDQIVSRLNQLGVQPPYGTAWTEEIFRAEMKRLGA